jgi:MFS family permease
VLSALAAGRFADKLDARTVLVVAVAVFGLGAAGLATLRTDLGLIAYIIPIVLLGAGWGLFQTSNNHIVLGECDAASRGAVSGWMSLARNVGLIGGTALIGTLFGAVTRGDAESGLAVAAAVRTSFTVGTAMVIVALALVVFVYVKRPTTATA